MSQCSKENSATLRLFGVNGDKEKETVSKITLPDGAALSYSRDKHIIHLTVSAPTKELLDCAIQAVFESEAKKHIADDSVKTLEEATVYFLRRKGLTLALAESCTGGLCAARIVNVSGASDVFLGSVVSYANSAKNRLLGVRKSTLEKHGAVSHQTVVEMAEGARKNFGADIGLSVSGVAGPTGGTKQKPIGTVYFGYSSEHGNLAVKASFGDIGRSKVREASVDLMLHKIIEHTVSRKDKLYTI